jgi:hypothetical protein
MLYVRALAFRVGWLGAHSGAIDKYGSFPGYRNAKPPLPLTNCRPVLFINKLGSKYVMMDDQWAPAIGAKRLGIYHATVGFKRYTKRPKMFGICRVLTRKRAGGTKMWQTAHRTYNGCGSLLRTKQCPPLIQNTRKVFLPYRTGFKTSCLARAWSVKPADIVVASSNIQLALQPDTRIFC